MNKTETTLLLLRKDNKIMLGKCKRGFSKGKYNGIGGKIDPGETPEQAMIRECQEEILVTPTKYEKVGFIEFLEFVKGQKEKVLFHLYIATEWNGEPAETEEMKPYWFSIDKIPYEKMFPDDKYWMPMVLVGKKIKGFFEFDENWNILSHKLEEEQIEYLDTYDENKNFLGKELRDIVHEKGLWHNTVHCWLYDKDGNVYFQKRKDTGTFYTTASGHVSAGETIKEGFGREIKEEIGIDIDYKKAILVKSGIWKMDKEMPDGTIFKDRAFANVYVCKVAKSKTFNYNKNEVDGIVKVNAKDALSLFENGNGKISAEIITIGKGKTIREKRNVDFTEFLVNKHETAIGKYGYIMNKVIELTNKSGDPYE